MARRNLLACSMALTAILAIIAGNLSPVIGKRDLSNSLPTGKELGEGASDSATAVQPAHSMMSKTEKDTPLSGSWNIVNNAGGIISAHCNSQVTDLGTSTMYPQDSISHSFPILPYIAEAWSCEFKWDSLTGPLQQDFRVWAHDGRTGFLLTCFDCEWEVRADGFYFKYKDGEFYRRWQWTPWNGQN